MARGRLRRRSGGGFSLVEAMACVALAGGVAAGLLAAQARAVASLAEARETLICAELCASLAARARAGLARPGEGEFAHPKGYRWSLALDGETPHPWVAAYVARVEGPSGSEISSASAPVWVFRQPDETEGQP